LASDCQIILNETNNRSVNPWKPTRNKNKQFSYISFQTDTDADWITDTVRTDNYSILLLQESHLIARQPHRAPNHV